MINLLQGASDDQVALIGCLVALTGSMMLMYISFFVGPAGRQKAGDAPLMKTRQIPIRPMVDMREEAIREKAA